MYNGILVAGVSFNDSTLNYIVFTVTKFNETPGAIPTSVFHDFSVSY